MVWSIFRSKPSLNFLMACDHYAYSCFWGFDWVPWSFSAMINSSTEIDGFDLGWDYSTVVGIQMLNYQREEDEKNIRRRTAVNMAVNTLSYSELWAVSAILVNWKAMRASWTVYHCRSDLHHSLCDVNALRKLELSQAIESRSLEWNPSQSVDTRYFWKKLRKETTNGLKH